MLCYSSAAAAVAAQRKGDRENPHELPKTRMENKTSRTGLIHSVFTTTSNDINAAAAPQKQRRQQKRTYFGSVSAHLEDRRVGYIEGKTRLGDELPRLCGLLLPLLRQRDVLPPRETVLVVPGALPVPSRRNKQTNNKHTQMFSR